MERTSKGNSRRDRNDHQIHGNVYSHLKETQNKMRSLLCPQNWEVSCNYCYSLSRKKKIDHASKALKCISFGSVNTP